MDRIPIVETDTGRYCVRCQAKIFHLDPPHLCSDLKARLERQQWAIGTIEEVLTKHNIKVVAEDFTLGDVAEAILKALSERINWL